MIKNAKSKNGFKYIAILIIIILCLTAGYLARDYIPAEIIKSFFSEPEVFQGYMFEAYASEIENRYAESPELAKEYAIFDLDRDSIPEIIIMRGLRFEEDRLDIYRYNPETDESKLIGVIDGKGRLYSEPADNIFYNIIGYHGRGLVYKCVIEQDSVSEIMISEVSYLEDKGYGKYDPDFDKPYINGNEEVNFQLVDENTPAQIRALGADKTKLNLKSAKAEEDSETYRSADGSESVYSSYELYYETIKNYADERIERAAELGIDIDLYEYEYAIKDINSDGIDEMVIQEKIIYEDGTVADDYNFTAVYTLDNKKPKELRFIARHGQFFVTSDGYIIDVYKGATINKLIGTELTRIADKSIFESENRDFILDSFLEENGVSSEFMNFNWITFEG